MDLPELVGLRFYDWTGSEAKDCGNFEALKVGMVKVSHNTICWVVSDTVVGWQLSGAFSHISDSYEYQPSSYISNPILSMVTKPCVRASSNICFHQCHVPPICISLPFLHSGQT